MARLNSGVRGRMLNRFPKQAAARRAYALLGVIFLLFSTTMALLESTAGMVIGLIVGALLLIPSITFSEAAFTKTERLLSRLGIPW